MYKKKSLFQRITKIFQFDDAFFDEDSSFDTLIVDEKQNVVTNGDILDSNIPEKELWMEDVDIHDELSVDMYEQDEFIVIQAMVAGVKPESLEITIGRDMVVIQGKRDDLRKVNKQEFFITELYWGSFSRSISLPVEIDPDLSEAVEKYGLLTLKLPKINRAKRTIIKVKSM